MTQQNCDAPDLTDLIDPELEAEVRTWRQTIHANPEMAFQETDTAALAARALREFGYDVQTGIAGTGVIGTIKFGKGPAIALRADMDALPIQEANDLPYASQNPGCMHACGHDGHTAILLGVAKLLSARRDLSGTVHIIFQPAEENEGGAKAMLEDGLLDGRQIDRIYALHNFPGLPIGHMVVRPGPMLASFDRFDITITGRGGHGAMPEHTINPIQIGAELVNALGSIVSSAVPPQSSAVLAIGAFRAEGAYNVVPNTAHIQGSCRALSAPIRQILRQRIQDICTGLSAAHQASIDCDYQEGYPVLVNHDGPTRTVITALRKRFGNAKVSTDIEPIMGSEDFAFFLEKIPGCYFAIGNGERSSQIHTNSYNFNDAALKIGIAAFVSIIEQEIAGDNRA